MAPVAVRKMPRLGQAQQAIVGALKGAGSDVRLKELADMLKDDFSKTSIYNAADRLKDLALVEISGGVVHLIKQ